MAALLCWRDEPQAQVPATVLHTLDVLIPSIFIRLCRDFTSNAQLVVKSMGKCTGLCSRYSQYRLFLVQVRGGISCHTVRRRWKNRVAGAGGMEDSRVVKKVLWPRNYSICLIWISFNCSFPWFSEFRPRFCLSCHNLQKFNFDYEKKNPFAHCNIFLPWALNRSVLMRTVCHSTGFSNDGTSASALSKQTNKQTGTKSNCAHSFGRETVLLNITKCIITLETL